MEVVEFKTWTPSEFKEFELEILDPKLKRNVRWTIHELITSQQLYAECRIMHHCAGS